MSPTALTLIFLAALLLFITKGSSSNEEMKITKLSTPAPVQIPPAKAPTLAPVKPPTAAPPLPPVKSKADCVPLCNTRCALHSRKNVCARACLTCCDRCKCVPPGTSGNREMCGKCYTDMTTHGNLFKCP